MYQVEFKRLRHPSLETTFLWCLLLLLRIRFAHLEILGFPMGDSS